jgi:hypothetical protein
LLPLPSLLAAKQKKRRHRLPLLLLSPHRLLLRHRLLLLLKPLPLPLMLHRHPLLMHLLPSNQFGTRLITSVRPRRHRHWLGVMR